MRTLLGAAVLLTAIFQRLPQFKFDLFEKVDGYYSVHYLDSGFEDVCRSSDRPNHTEICYPWEFDLNMVSLIPEKSDPQRKSNGTQPQSQNYTTSESLEGDNPMTITSTTSFCFLDQLEEQELTTPLARDRTCILYSFKLPRLFAFCLVFVVCVSLTICICCIGCWKYVIMEYDAAVVVERLR